MSHTAPRDCRARVAEASEKKNAEPGWLRHAEPTQVRERQQCLALQTRPKRRMGDTQPSEIKSETEYSAMRLPSQCG
eukprot:3094565-Pyramimonas_sp.AAC.1